MYVQNLANIGWIGTVSSISISVPDFKRPGHVLMKRQVSIISHRNNKVAKLSAVHPQIFGPRATINSVAPRHLLHQLSNFAPCIQYSVDVLYIVSQSKIASGTVNT